MTGLYTLTSPLHDEAAVNAASASFISEIEEVLGWKFENHGPDFSTYGSEQLSLIYVRTGGTEGLFQEVFANLDGPILLLTSGKSNSLAASMEILSFLNQQGRSGEIRDVFIDFSGVISGSIIAFLIYKTAKNIAKNRKKT